MLVDNPEPQADDDIYKKCIDAENQMEAYLVKKIIKIH